MHILLLFVILIVIALVIGVSLIRTVLQILFSIGRFFGFGKERQQRAYRSRSAHWEDHRSAGFDSSANGSGHEARANAEHSSNKSQKKIFDRDEGEYIDFEEVKDDSSR